MRVYRVSALGYSLEALVAPHLGYEPVKPPEFLQNAYDEGTRLEPIVLDTLRDHGWEIGREQEEVQITIIPDGVVIVGHLDGIGGLNGIQSVIEVKTMAHKSFMDFKVHGWDSLSPLIEKYKWQQSAYLIGSGLSRHSMVAWDKENEEIAVHHTDKPFYSVEQLANKVLAAEQYIRDGVLPDGCTDYPCAYFYLHENKEAVETASADSDLEELLEAWLQRDRAEKVYKKEKDALREQIISLVGSEEAVAKVKGACGVTVSTTWVEEKDVKYTVGAHWETRIQGPRNGK